MKLIEVNRASFASRVPIHWTEGNTYLGTTNCHFGWSSVSNTYGLTLTFCWKKSYSC
jgi:hypothetical protein